MSEVTERLRRAVELGGLPSIRALWTKLRDEGLYETTYSTVHRYFTGGVEEPPLEFLRATAKATGVREAWLVLGYGTDQREHSEFSEALADILQRSFPGWERLRGPTRTFVVATMQGAIAAATPRDVDAWTEGFLEALLAPMRQLGLMQPHEANADRFNTYVMNLCMGIQALSPPGTEPGGIWIKNAFAPPPQEADDGQEA